MSALTCRIAHAFNHRLSFDAGMGLLTDQERRGVLSGSGIRHAAVFGAQVALCALAAKNALASLDVCGERLGLITNGGPWAADASLNFLRQIDERGHMYANPLHLPATLVSAAPTSAASVVGAKAFAIAAGFDELAFFDVLRRAKQMLTRGVVDHVLALAGCAPSQAIKMAFNRIGCAMPVLDCGISMLLSNQVGALGGDEWGTFELIDAVYEVGELTWPAIERKFEATINEDGSIYFSVDHPLSAGSALSASGAVLCQTAMYAMMQLGRGSEDFLIVCKKSSRVGAAWFRYIRN